MTGGCFALAKDRLSLPLISAFGHNVLSLPSLPSSSSSFTNSFLAESSTVSERDDRLPNGGRAVRRHDDGDENERRRCCGHSGHAARTFGAFVEEEDEEEEKEKGMKNKGRRERERERGQ